MEPQPIKDLIPAAIIRLTTTPSSEVKLSGWRPVIDAYEPSLAVAADACAKFVADMEHRAEPYWLTLSGRNGCGKTMLAKQLFAEAKRINPGNPKNNPIWPPDWQTNEEKVYSGSRPYCLWFDEADFAAKMRAGQYDLPETVRTDFLVVLDELGFVRDPTNFVADAIATLAQKRLKSWMIWATNLNLSEIAERIDARIASRLIRDGNVVVQIKSGDYALRPKLDRYAQQQISEALQRTA